MAKSSPAFLEVAPPPQPPPPQFAQRPHYDKHGGRRTLVRSQCDLLCADHSNFRERERERESDREKHYSILSSQDRVRASTKAAGEGRRGGQSAVCVCDSHRSFAYGFHDVQVEITGSPRRGQQQQQQQQQRQRRGKQCNQTTYAERASERGREGERERAHLSLFPLCIPPPPPPPQSPPLSSCRLLPPSLLRGRRARRSKKLNRRPTRREDESVGRSLARSFSRLLESSVRRRLRLSLASVCPSVVVIPVPPPPTRATDGDGRRATDDRGAPSFLEKIWAEIK